MGKFLIVLVLLLAGKNPSGDAAPQWKPLAPGLDILTFRTEHPAVRGDSQITVLRIDPAGWDLEFAGGRDKSARAWGDQEGFVAAINAGMFREGSGQHAGYVGSGDQVRSKKITSYQSLAAFGPKTEGRPRFRIFDLARPSADLPAIAADYRLTVENLRLIQRPGVDKWRPDAKKASEAALGEDDTGRILFIFARSPFSMYELNEELLKARIGVVAAQYLEGGPEAQLYVHVGQTRLEMFGSYETAFKEDDKNAQTWPIPNVLGIRPRHVPAK